MGPSIVLAVVAIAQTLFALSMMGESRRHRRIAARWEKNAAQSMEAAAEWKKVAATWEDNSRKWERIARQTMGWPS